MGAVLVVNVRTMREGTVAMMRNFYGALRIQEFKTGLQLPYRSLVHGTIEHGAQYLAFPENRNPTTYYGRRSGVGLALRFCCDGPKRVGVIGLGAGTLAAYGKPGDSFRFYEINPQVVQVANGWFTFLKQSPAKTEIILGDARLSLGERTVAAIRCIGCRCLLGRRHSCPPAHQRSVRCVLPASEAGTAFSAIHTSNTYLKLAPVVKLLGEDADYATRLISSDEDAIMMVSSADWVLVTRNQEFLNKPETFAGSENIEVPQQLRLWTDDYNNLYEILRPVSYVTHPSDGT